MCIICDSPKDNLLNCKYTKKQEIENDNYKLYVKQICNYQGSTISGLLNIKELYICCCPNLKVISNMKNLCKLYITDCASLEIVDLCELKNINHLYLNRCSNLSTIYGCKRSTTINIYSCPRTISIQNLEDE